MKKIGETLIIDVSSRFGSAPQRRTGLLPDRAEGTTLQSPTAEGSRMWLSRLNVFLGPALGLYWRLGLTGARETIPRTGPLLLASNHASFLDPWFIAMGHGHFVDDDEASHRSSLITPGDIARTEADYVALGHWHVTTDVSQGPVSAWYCGAPSGRPGGHALIVDLHVDAGVQVTAIEVPLDPTGCADHSPR